jgi:hypothetical protein
MWQTDAMAGATPMAYLRRREFIVVLGVAATVRSRAAQSQNDGRTRVVGVQLGTSPDDAEQRQLLDAFVKELARLGWDADRNLGIEYRWGAGDPHRIREQAADLAGLARDVMLGQGTPVTTPLRQATGTIPRVCSSTWPTRSAAESSRAWPAPGAMSRASPTMKIRWAAWLDILKDIAPRLRTLHGEVRLSFPGLLLECTATIIFQLGGCDGKEPPMSTISWSRDKRIGEIS